MSQHPHFDVVVIGAGINGAGIARDAAMRQLRVLLLDKGDIASGTSSFSTRLIHGGLRYLEHGELGLVRESLRERETLLRIAPHLVKPIRMLVPLYKNRRRGGLTIRAGMLAYDLLSFDKSLDHHQMLSSDEVLTECPGLRVDGLMGGAVYADAQVEFAERLVFENVLSAQEHDATIRTYEKVTAIHQASDGLTEIELKNQINGTSSRVRTKEVVNAAGPWVDQVLETTDFESRKLIGGTKGSHIVIDPFPGAPRTALYVEAEADARPFFVIPWNEKYLIGTTDERFAGDLDSVAIDDHEIDYLLSETNNLFPQASLSHGSILFSYSGVRPLPSTANASERRITRRHFILVSENDRMISLVGGKLTTYRQLAQETVDVLFKRLKKRDPGCGTADQKLPGAAATGESLDLEPEERKRLLGIYGSRTAELVNLMSSDPTLARILDLESHAIAAEVVFAFRSEMAQTLSDCLLRRMMVGWDSAAGMRIAQEAAKVAKEYFGWSEGRQELEMEIYRQALKRFTGTADGLVRKKPR